MDLYFSQSETGTDTRRLVTVESQSDGRKEIFFDLVGERGVPEPETLDAFVFAVIFYAMKLGENLRVHGPVSRSALRNLREFQEAWSTWRRGTYKRISIEPDRIVDLPRGSGKAIAAFSGGADSMFTILRHSDGSLGNGAYELGGSVLMVHGFDVPLSETGQFEKLCERTQPFLDQFGFLRKVIRTNVRSAIAQDWEDSFIAMLSCCLHNYAHEFSAGLAGSSEPYDALIAPWGSHPAIDPLLSGDTFKLVHDGAGFSRTEKIELIAKNPIASNALKVCWEGKNTFENCGECDKCVRTKLNFLAVGVSDPPCFDNPLTHQQVRRILIVKDVICNEYRSIVEYAKRNGINAPWVAMLNRKVHFYGPKFTNEVQHCRKVLRWDRAMYKSPTMSGV